MAASSAANSSFRRESLSPHHVYEINSSSAASNSKKPIEETFSIPPRKLSAPWNCHTSSPGSTFIEVPTPPRRKISTPISAEQARKLQTQTPYANPPPSRSQSPAHPDNYQAAEDTEAGAERPRKATITRIPSPIPPRFLGAAPKVSTQKRHPLPKMVLNTASMDREMTSQFGTLDKDISPQHSPSGRPLRPLERGATWRMSIRSRSLEAMVEEDEDEDEAPRRRLHSAIVPRSRREGEEDSTGNWQKFQQTSTALRSALAAAAYVEIQRTLNKSRTSDNKSDKSPNRSPNRSPSPRSEKGRFSFGFRRSKTPSPTPSRDKSPTSPSPMGEHRQKNLSAVDAAAAKPAVAFDASRRSTIISSGNLLKKPAFLKLMRRRSKSQCSDMAAYRRVKSPTLQRQDSPCSKRKLATSPTPPHPSAGLATTAGDQRKRLNSTSSSKNKILLTKSDGDTTNASMFHQDDNERNTDIERSPSPNRFSLSKYSQFARPGSIVYKNGPRSSNPNTTLHPSASAKSPIAAVAASELRRSGSASGSGSAYASGSASPAGTGSALKERRGSKAASRSQSTSGRSAVESVRGFVDSVFERFHSSAKKSRDVFVQTERVGGGGGNGGDNGCERMETGIQCEIIK